jgi:hypothetical protein
MRVLRRPARVLRQIVTPGTGRHRPRRPVLLPDQPITAAAPVPHEVLDDDELERLLDAQVIAANEFATCRAEERRTFHAFYRNGIRACWTCGSQAAGDAIAATTARGNS